MCVQMNGHTHTHTHTLIRGKVVWCVHFIMWNI